MYPPPPLDEALGVGIDVSEKQDEAIGDITTGVGLPLPKVGEFEACGVEP